MYEHFSAPLLIAIASAIIYIFFKAYNARKAVYRLRKQGLPMPPFSWITGHMLALKPFMDQLPTDAITNYTVTELAFSLGTEAFYLDFWPLSEPLLILTSPAMASQLTQQFNPLKPPVIEKAFAGLTGGPNLFTMPDESWKRWRAIFSPGFSPTYMLQQTPKIVDECRVFCEKMRARASENQMFHLEEDTLRLTLDVIGVVTLDTCFQYQEFTSWVPESLRALIEWTSFGTELNPFNRWNPMRPYSLWYHGRKINRFLEAELDKRFLERRYANDSKRDTESVKSIVALALDSYIAEESAQGVSSDVAILDKSFKHYACAQIRLFLFAGHDTTSSTMVYTLHLLATNPDCLSRIRTEHDEVFGAGTSPDRVGDLLSANPHLLNQLPYTTACIKEALRLFPPASAMRVGGRSTVLTGSDGTRYPTVGCNVWGLHLAIQRNPAAFPQPNAFVPERWLPTTKPDDPLHPPKGAWRPFEFGPRNCIGQTLAMAEIKVLLAMAVRQFDFRPAYDEWDGLHPGGRSVKTALGDRAYQVEGGGGACILQPRTNAVLLSRIITNPWAVKAPYRLFPQASAPVAVPVPGAPCTPTCPTRAVLLLRASLSACATALEMAFEPSPHLLVRGATLEQLVEQPVLVGWNNEANGQQQHIGCLSTASRRDRASLTLRIGRAGFGSHQRLLISFHLPVCTRATQRKTEKNMYLVVPAERLHIDLDVVNPLNLPETTRGQLRNNNSEGIGKGILRARFSLATAAYVVMPKLRRPLARPLTGAPARLMSSLRALSEVKEFDVYLNCGDVEHRLQKIHTILRQHLIDTPEVDIQATFGGGYGGGKNLWESYPCIEAGELAWNPLVDDPPPYDAVLCDDVSAEPPATKKPLPQPPTKKSGRRVSSWTPDRPMPAEVPSIFEKTSEPSKIKQLLMSWAPDPQMDLNDCMPKRSSAAMQAHKRRVRSDGAILAKGDGRVPQRQAAYESITEAATSYISSPEVPQPLYTRPPDKFGDKFGDEKSIISAYSTAPTTQHRLPTPISPPPHVFHHRLPTPISPPPHSLRAERGTDVDPHSNPASPVNPDHSASLLRAAILALLHSRDPSFNPSSTPSSSSPPPDAALLHTPHLFLELQEWLAAAAQLDPLAHETQRPQLFALGAAAREGRTSDFDAGLRACQRDALQSAWAQWPPAENLLPECFDVLDWLNGVVCRNAGTVMLPMLVGLRGAAQDVGMMGVGNDEAEKAWREAVAEVRAAAFWAFG
ncbi:hypothetical protein SLS55_000002 [Diplodia seriata]|uniref:Cytochrome P450 n=1 Tax=Diplodia seriata TaxID=420778 RepID=A0ABR3CW33_9PEZI